MKANTIKIRLANSSDAQTIANFQIDMAMETENYKLDKKTVSKGVKAVFNDTTKGIYYVAELNNNVIGSLMITFEWSDWRNSTVLWIQSVYVAPDERKKGVFKMLYDAVFNLWQENKEKYSGIRLYVDKTNTNAMKVYSKMGMNGEHYQVFEKM